MMPRRWITLAVLLIAAILLAFLLAGPARDTIIIPLAKLWWMIKGVYGSFPQVEYWIVILLLVAFLLILALFSRGISESGVAEDASPHHPGDVQQMAYWIARSRRGFYSRWHVARRLADISIEILEAAGYNARAARMLRGEGWDPPPPVQRYLETALRTTFADFSRKHSNGLTDALDVDTSEVVTYLESVLEIEHEHKNP